MAKNGVKYPQTPLASLADFFVLFFSLSRFFSPFSPNVEPGTRLLSLSLTSIRLSLDPGLGYKNLFVPAMLVKISYSDILLGRLNSEID